ncbi:MAG: right-handed parallel beta-helix repeat-containing protein [Candidatus Thermoplasmatota archaeon]|jgi:parallel beta-helix repeat protein|nr:right-handed parallel beta-helix repeat-containing protein [Candidatus Thermoplasmatota archaeon]
MKRLPQGAIAIFILLSSLLFGPILNQNSDGWVNDGMIGKGAPPLFADHAPITISGNSGLLTRASAEGWPGTGSSDDPIIISNYRIVANSQYGISLGSIDLHLQISGCNITTATVAGIHLNNVMNANISENKLYSNQGDGIALKGSSLCRVTNNTLKGAEVVNNYNGISLTGSFMNLIESNEATLCVNDGIGAFEGSDDNVIRSNIVKENLNNGIEVQGNGNHIERNHLLYNRAGVKITGDLNSIFENRPTQNGYGIELSNASSNHITYNVMVRNFQGISVITSYSNEITGNYILKSFDYGINLNCNLQSKNVLYDNVLFYNNETSSFFQKGLVQAKDVSGDSIWHSPSNRGNHWWDWRVPDNDEDFIIDFPYKLHGNNGKDPYPLLRSPIPDLFTSPGSLKATPGADFINLSWTKPYYSLEIKVQHYNLYRSERGGGEFLYKQLDGRSTFFVDEEVVSGRGYYYYMTAWNGYAESNRSNRVKSSPDTKSPSVTIIGPENGEYVNTSWALLRWSGSDNIKIDRYELSLDGGPFKDQGLNESYEAPYLKDGPHSFKVRIFDLAEHMNEKDAGFTVDTVRPDLVIDGGPGGDLLFNTDRPLIFFRGWDTLSPIMDYRIKYHTFGWRSLGITDSYRLDPIPDGFHNITIMVLDMANNWRARAINITVDTIPPKFTVLSPLDGSFQPSEDIIVSWVPKPDLTEPLQYEIRVDYEDWRPPIKETSIRIKVIGEGEHGIEVRALDRAGNAYSTTSAFTVDKVPPKVRITTPMEGSMLNSLFFVEWTAVDERAPIVLYKVYLDNVQISEIEEGAPVAVQRISEGSHVIKVEAQDRAGNIGSDTTSFIFDPTPPTIVSVHPTGKEIDVEDFIRVSFSEKMETAAVRIDGLPSGHELVWEGKMVLNVILFEPLSYSTHYVLSVHGTDEAKNQLIRFEWSFWTLADPRIATGTVKGRTVDTQGQPLMNVSIRFRSGEKVQTGQDGKFEVQVVPGDGILTASMRDYLDTSVDYNVSEGGIIDLGDIPLRLIPPEDDKEKDTNLTVLVLIIAIASMATAAGILVAYQVKKTKEYEKLPLNEKDEWVNVHDLGKK